MAEVTPTSYLALFVAALVQQLADCAAFQTLVGAANATAAKGSIIKDAGGDPATGATAVDGTSINCATEAFAIVRRGDATRIDRGAALTWGWEIPFEIDLVMRATDGDTEPSDFTRAENTADGIRAEFEALFGASTARIAWGTVSPAAILKSDDIKALRGALVARLTGTTRDLP
jgi:hypothetical protein